MSFEVSNVSNIEDVADGLLRNLERTKEVDHITLQVTWNDHTSELSYIVIASDPLRTAGDWIQAVPNGLERIAKFWKKLGDILNDAIPIGDPSDKVWDSINLSLRSQGKQLFYALIPLEVREYINDLQPDFSIAISTNEQWIPWELIHDEKDFFGRKFLITRCPRYPQINRVKKVANTVQESLRASGCSKLRKIVNAVGGNIKKNDAKRAAQLFDALESLAQIEVLHEQPVSVLNQALKEADAFHCTCHGHINPHHLLQISANTSLTQNLSVEDVCELEIKPGSFIFVNACASDAPEQLLGGFSSFGWEFYKKGAGLFVGTIGIVPVEYAITFAEDIYKELFDPNNKSSIIQAIARAKKLASSKRNLFWLLYCVYGNPNFGFEVERVNQVESSSHDH